MKSLKTVFSAVLFLISFNTAARALELNSIHAGDVRELSAGQAAPEPRAVLDEAFTQKDGLDPVVLTIPGLSFGEIGWGPLELKHFLKLLKLLLPKKSISEEDLATAFVSFNREYFFLDDAEAERDLAETSKTPRLPDNYLELKLHEIPGYENHNVIVEPFAWSRDPGDTEQTVPELAQKIISVYDAYKATGRPLYILAHSWGSVLAHEALHRVERVRPDVHIDKLITAGSPLVPANFVVKLFMKVEVEKEHLETAVTKPAIVKTWRNIWAMRDAYSNAIPAADSNFQADSAVENLEPTLINLILHNKLLKKEARKDLFKMRDIKAWHGSYFFDYKAELNSIHKEIFVEIFKPVLAPQVISCVKNPAPMCVP